MISKSDRGKPFFWPFLRMNRRYAVLFGAAFAALAILGVVRVALHQSEPIAVPRLSLLSSDEAPTRIVLYVIDALRPDHLDVYGYERDTAPQITQLAREGAIFTRCFSNTTWTLESVRGLFIGMSGSMYSWSKKSSKVSESLEILPEHFREAGWATGLVTENVHVTETYGLAQGFDYVGNSSAILGTSDDVAETVLRMSDATEAHLKMFVQQHADRKFFLYVHTMETHGPLIIPETIEPFYTDESTPQEDLAGWYDTAIRWADRRLASLVDLLKEEGLYENTLLLITADHGESLIPGKASGTHRGPPLFDRVHIPLIVRWPEAVPANSIFSENVQFLDLGPTILEAAGIPWTRQYQGTSLVRLLTLGTDVSLVGRPIFTAGQHMNGWGVVQNQWYLFSSRGSKRLFDLGQDTVPGPDRSDANEELIRDLSRLADAHFSTQQRLFAEFESSRRQTLLGSLKKAFGSGNNPKVQSTEPEMDEEHRRALEALGYLD